MLIGIISRCIYHYTMKIPQNNRILRNISYGGRFSDIIDGVDLQLVAFKDNLNANSEICRLQKTLDGDTVTYVIYVTYKNGDT
jgi:hypothetical protein